uniref:Uncharacterized protein n=1 Tax=Bracon brevicornis TaxID=1563983 RepID=A0A6V7ISS1_9HYME
METRKIVFTGFQGLSGLFLMGTGGLQEPLTQGGDVLLGLEEDVLGIEEDMLSSTISGSVIVFACCSRPPGFSI